MPEKIHSNMDIDFKKIRPLDGDRKLGFEELCCQLAEIDAERETGSHFVPHNFHRKEGKAGDAGVECYYVFSDGNEWGWQAKYFINGLGPVQWRQIDESVKTALERHPRLARYTICLPINLSDSRVSGKKSQMDDWREHQAQWAKLTDKSGSRTEFILWGAFELRKRLLDLGDRGAGYILYWFNEQILTSEWFLARYEEAEKDAGPRYTRELNVDLPISSLFDAFGRTDSFVNKIGSFHDRVLRKWKELNRWSGLKETEELSGPSRRLIDQMERLSAALDGLSEQSFEDIDLEDLSAPISELMRGTAQTMERAREERHEQGHLGGSQSAIGHFLTEFLSALNELAEFIHSADARCARQHVVLLSGEAGIGKTHLLCDLARKRLAEDLPTVLLLGQKFFPGNTPWSQIVQQLQLGEIEPEKFLGILDATARARRKRALILIDALNEGAGDAFWKTYLGGMVATLSRFPGVVLAVSCRESYVEDAIPETLLSTGEIYQVRHYGFEGHELDATRSFFSFYGLQSPAEPLLVPEFSNPLFLKLLCKGLQNEKMNKVPKGLTGITKLFDFFINSVNTKLAERLSMDPKEHIVGQVVEVLAKAMAEKEQAWLDRKEAKELINRVRQEPQEYERMLFRNLIREGLLREERYRSAGNEGGTDVVLFAYERLADHLIVSHCLQAAAGLDKPKAILAALPLVERMSDDEWFARRHAGWIEALSIQVPELVGKELVQLSPRLKRWTVFRRAFLQSLLWRQPGTVGTGAIRIFNKLLNSGFDDEFQSAMEVLLMVGCDPDHPLNAKSLHRWLSGFSMADRDSFWSVFLYAKYAWEEEGLPDRLIDWAWRADKQSADDHVIELCAIVLTWFLTSSHRFLRDRATKALVSMLRERPRVLCLLLDHFEAVNDPYVSERLYAVAYGVAMLTHDDAALALIAEHVFKKVFADECPPPHILLRDYARGVIEVAAHRRILPGNVNRDLSVPAYRSPWPPIIPTEDELAPHGEWHDDRDHLRWPLARLYHSIVGSVHGESDWAIYQLRPACNHFGWVSPNALGVQDLVDDTPEGAETMREGFDSRLAQRWVMKRILDLGWTEDRFGVFDEDVAQFQRYRRIDTSKPERVGKKYAWIAMHEFLGQLSDHVAFHGDNYWGGEPGTYCGPWQIGLRDIDPSLMTRRNLQTRKCGLVPCWWQPIAYRFAEEEPENYEDWVRDCGDLFDPLDLIQVRDAQGHDYLTLEGLYDWTEEPALGEEPHEIPRRNLWFMIKSYVVKASHSSALVRWINRRNLWGRWMPESGSVYDVFLGEYPWAPAFAPHEAGQEWTKRYRQELPHPVVVTALTYTCEKGYDCSIDATVSALLPSPWLVRSIQLQWSRKGFSFVDVNGKIVAFDPSERESGPSALLISRDALTSFLGGGKYDLIWTALGERRVLGPAFGEAKGEHGGRTILQATCRLRGGKVSGGPLRAEYEP